MNANKKSKITLFHCINAFSEATIFSSPHCEEFDINIVKMPCSSMTKDVYLLRAFEAGADAVAVMICPVGGCRYVEGNARAVKRVEWVKKILDEIGINGKRLSIHNVSVGDEAAVNRIFTGINKDLAELGPNPAS